MYKTPLLKPEQWHSNYTNFLIGYATRKVPMHVAEDLVQETFLSALKAAPSYKGNSTERTWLMGILRHKIIDYYRSINSKKALTKERAVSPSKFNGYDPLESNALRLDNSNPEMYLILNDLAEILDKGFDFLSEKESNVIKLKIQGMETHEICHRLNIKPSYCWFLISKARKKLREFLRKIA